MNKYVMAQWIIKVIKSCEFSDQARNCERLMKRHILTFRDVELYDIIVAEWSRKMRSCRVRWKPLERQYKLKLDIKNHEQ